MIFIDTNVFLDYLFETRLSDKAEKILSMKELCISGIVIDETLFVIARTKAFSKLGIKNIHDFREHISKNGYSFCEMDFKEFYDLLELMEIEIYPDHFDKLGFLLLMTKYKLLPNDALIVATCKHYEINKIATFDHDFKRVEFLEIITNL
ncbi:MAG: PIN domain-containing protein [Methanophagales archaeon]|nr:PIN domain-containing protein [Methanophagales archaeon]